MDDFSDEDSDAEAERHSEGSSAAMMAVAERDQAETGALDIGQRDFETSLCQTIQQRGKRKQ